MKPYLRTTDSHVGQIVCAQPLRLPLSHRFISTTRVAFLRLPSFWEDVVGLPLILDQGTCRIYRISPDGYLGFCEKEGVSTAKDGVIITLVTEKVDEVIVKLRARGLSLEKSLRLTRPSIFTMHFFVTRMVCSSKCSDSKIPQWPKPHSRLSR